MLMMHMTICFSMNIGDAENRKMKELSTANTFISLNCDGLGGSVVK